MIKCQFTAEMFKIEYLQLAGVRVESTLKPAKTTFSSPSTNSISTSILSVNSADVGRS